MEGLVKEVLKCRTDLQNLYSKLNNDNKTEIELELRFIELRLKTTELLLKNEMFHQIGSLKNLLTSGFGNRHVFTCLFF